MRLEIKFRERTPPAGRERAIAKVSELCGIPVKPLFPGESDPRLASLFKADGVPAERIEGLLEAVEALEEVEFAERSPERRLIR